MANSQLIKNVGVVDRNICNDKIGDEQLLEHVGANVALLDKFARRAARQTRLPHGRTNEFLFNPVEIDSILGAEGTHNKYIHHGLAFTSILNSTTSPCFNCFVPSLIPQDRSLMESLRRAPAALPPWRQSLAASSCCRDRPSHSSPRSFRRRTPCRSASRNPCLTRHCSAGN